MTFHLNDKPVFDCFGHTVYPYGFGRIFSDRVNPYDISLKSLRKKLSDELRFELTRSEIYVSNSNGQDRCISDRSTIRDHSVESISNSIEYEDRVAENF